MWIVILNFCLFLLLIGFFFYGIRKWSGLIAEDEEGDDENSEELTVVDGYHYRLPLWILIFSAGLVSFAGNVMNWLGF
ncbi:MAG: hypothetical protein PHD82_05185 [Candidatus Riflebacteria bacterium]|jgi:hypothetical protein|nr:hypothetical protein [Candidatus Riflebacteria bacterium]